MNNLKPIIALDQLYFESYFHLFKRNQTVLICSWPYFIPEQKDSIKKQKEINNLSDQKKVSVIDILRRKLIRHSYYIEGLRTHNLRILGFKSYGPIIAISADKNPIVFVEGIPCEIIDNISFMPIAFFWKGVFYKDYFLFMFKYTLIKEIYSRRFKIITTLIIKQFNIVSYRYKQIFFLNVQRVNKKFVTNI
jgi:hypothetical protein